MLNGTKIHPHNKHGIFGKNDMENAHDIMKTKTSEDRGKTVACRGVRGTEYNSPESHRKLA